MRLIVDCDPGNGVPGANIDDGLALALAVAAPELELKLITTVAGNTPVGLGTAIATDLLTQWGLAGSVPVIAGATGPLRQDPHAARERPDGRAESTGLAHLWDGLPRPAAFPEPIDPDAAAGAIGRLICDSPGEVTLVAIGPLTNVARALDSYPSLAKDVARIVIMGGAFQVPGYPVETNFGYDPEAAARVIGSGAEITLLPMDATTQTLLTPADLDRLALIDNDLTRSLVGTARPWLAFSAATRDIDGCWLHDPLAVALLVDPDLVRYRTATVEVRTSPAATRGSTFVLNPASAARSSEGCGSVRIVTTVDNRRLLELISARFAGWPPDATESSPWPSSVAPDHGD